MEGNTVVVILCVCITAITGNTQPPQRFQARKFLDMLGQTFDPQVAYLDLLTALHERLNLDPIGNMSGSSSAADSGITNPNAMAESATNCPVAPAERGASISYTSDTRILGSRAFYQCEVGYDGKSVFIQCLQGGKWSTFSGWTGCTPVNCGTPPRVANADSSQTTTTYGSMVMYTCQPGYKMDKPNANVTCLETGLWDTPTFTCTKMTTGSQNPLPFGSLFNGGGGNTEATTNQNPMMAALLQNMPGMQGMPGLNIPGFNQGAPPSNPSNNNNNNPMMAMLSQMFPNMGQPPTPPPPTTPKPVTNNPGMPSGFQLPSHLQSLLPNGISNSAGIKPQDLMALTSLGLGSATTGGAPRDITQLLGSMNPMSIFGGAMGMPSPGQPGATGAAGAGPGAPADPEKMAEQREEMMMRAAMASAMKSMMGNNQAQQGNTTSSSRNPAMEMMTLMALQSGLSGAGGAGGGSGSGGMDPLSMMFGGMSPAMLMGGGGGGGGAGGGLFGNLFGGA